jgi:hypothetical protein
MIFFSQVHVFRTQRCKTPQTPTFTFSPFISNHLLRQSYPLNPQPNFLSAKIFNLILKNLLLSSFLDIYFADFVNQQYSHCLG